MLRLQRPVDVLCSCTLRRIRTTYRRVPREKAMSGDDPLHSAKYVLEHANRRIAEFEREAGMFYDSEPYANLIEADGDTGYCILKVKLVKPLPAALPGIVFDALSNLRACLDQIGFATAKVANPAFGKHAHFPFGNSEAN